jgi:D-alanyl-D-alanine carboxypeptidase (penicillin-binding protein 5/6)
VGVVPGADGIKTGYTREAGYNFLGSAQREGRRLVMVLAGSPTPKIRDAAARSLLEWGFAEWHARHLFDKGQPVIEARVQGGNIRAVPLVADREVHASVPNQGNQPIALSVTYSGPLVAPLRKGEQVGELEIRVGDLEPGRVPLYVGRDVEEAGPLDRLLNGLINIFS